MRITTLALADTSLLNKEIESAVHKLSFTIAGAIADGTLSDMFYTMIGGAKLTMQKQGGGNDTISQSLQLSDLAEIGTYNEGFIDLESSGGNATLKFTVEVALNAAFKADDNTKIVLNIENKVAGYTWAIDAIDHANKTLSYIKYDNKYLNPNVSKDFPCAEHYAMAVIVADIVAVELYYDNNSVVKLSRYEYEQMLRDSQDIVGSKNGAVKHGYLDDGFGVINIENCWKVSLTCSQPTNAIFVKQVA